MNNTKDTIDLELKAIEAFAERYGYDTSYMKKMLSIAPDAYRVFGTFLPMAQFRQFAAPDVYFTAKLTAFRRVDCGPCLQLAIRIALEAGIDADLIRAVLSDVEQLNPLLMRVRAFALVILEGGLDCDDLRLQLIDEVGEPAVIEMALSVASAQIFPVIKRAMGHYRSCAITPLEI